MCLAVPGKVVAVAEDDSGLAMGRVEFSGVRKEVCLAWVPEAREGDYVLVHVGFAIARVDEEEARAVFRLLGELEAAP